MKRERGQPAHILLVEDNPGDVRLTREAFAESPIELELHVVPDGEDALDFLHQRGDYEGVPRPQLVLLDLNLPRVDGHTVLDRIRADPELARLPVVVLTGSAAEEDVVRSYESYTNAYLMKPSDPSEFVDLVRTFESFWLKKAQLPPVEG